MHLFPKIKIPALLLALPALLGQVSPSQAIEPRVAVGGHAALTSVLRTARSLGRLDGGTPLHLALTLPLRNQGQLSDLLLHQSTPGDPLYHKFLSPAQFDAAFAPTEADYLAVCAFAKSQGLTVTDTHSGRTLLGVSGTSATVEKAFNVQMARYQMADGSLCYANSGTPTVPGSVAAHLAGVVGLNNLNRMRPHYRPLSPRLALVPRVPMAVTGGTGPAGGLAPNDVKIAYNLSTITQLYGSGGNGTGGGGTGGNGGGTGNSGLLNGRGQTIGIFTTEGFRISDIVNYINQFKLPTPTTLTAAGSLPTVQTIVLPPLPYVDTIGPDTGEITADVELALALAPNANIYVYEGGPTAGIEVFTRMAEDTDATGTSPLLKVISCSFGVEESLLDAATRDAENLVFQRMAAQGQSVFCASGDLGAYDYRPNPLGTTLPLNTTLGVFLSVSDPASQPYVTGVGGTTLAYQVPVAATATLPATAGAYVSETAWGDSTESDSNPGGSPASVTNPPSAYGLGGGGGSSSVWPKPSYQQGLGASPFLRDVPDVALNSDPANGYDIYLTSITAGGTTGFQTVAGTSAAAPLWAGFAALVNQQRALNGLGTLGFANTTLYSIGRSTAYANNFHDITTGNNLYYPATVGYDDATGLGSFIGNQLLATLSFNPEQGTGTATLSGTVTDASGIPVVGATVSAAAVSTGIVRATTTTDATGSYTLTVPSGLSLKIVVDTVSVTTTTTATTVSAGQSVTLTLTAASVVTQNFTLSAAHAFAAGLQMISAPFSYTDVGDFAAIFGLTTPLINPNPRPIQWEPLINSYVFYPTTPADTLRPGQAYWIKFPAIAYLRRQGTAVSTAQSFRITLQAGWNQIGDPFQSPAPLSTITVTNLSGGSSATLAASTLISPTLYRYDTASNKYIALNPATDSLAPFDGEWIFAKQSAVLVIPPESPPAIPGGF